MKKFMLLSLFIATALSSYSKEVAPVVEEIVESEVVVTPVVVPTEVQAVVVSDEVSETFEPKNHLYFRTGLHLLSAHNELEIRETKGANTRIDKVTNGEGKFPGFTFAIENTRNVSNNFELGLGVAYHLNAKTKAYEGRDYIAQLGKYDSVPVYLTGKYNFSKFESGIQPYFKFNLGYAFNINEDRMSYTPKGGLRDSYKMKVDNGIYYGLGGGIQYESINVDLMIESTGGRGQFTDNLAMKKSNKVDYVNAKMTLSVGYKFDY